MDLRSNLNPLPTSRSFLKETNLPLCVSWHVSTSDQTNCSRNEIMRCESCFGYFNLYCELIFNQTKWKCNLCNFVNTLPNNFPVGTSYNKQLFKKANPELFKKEIGYNAPKKYITRELPIPTYVIVLEVTERSLNSPLFDLTIDTLVDLITNKKIFGVSQQKDLKVGISQTNFQGNGIKIETKTRNKIKIEKVNGKEKELQIKRERGKENENEKEQENEKEKEKEKESDPQINQNQNLAYLSLITFSDKPELHILKKKNGFTHQIMVVADPDNPFAFIPEDLCKIEIHKKESLTHFIKVLKNLRNCYKFQRVSPQINLMAGLSTALQLTTDSCGRIISIFTQFPTLGKYGLKFRKSKKILGTVKESTILKPSTEGKAYKNFSKICARSLIAIDLFLMPSNDLENEKTNKIYNLNPKQDNTKNDSLNDNNNDNNNHNNNNNNNNLGGVNNNEEYYDISSLRCVNKYCSGQFYYYPIEQIDKYECYKKDLENIFKSEQLYDVVMRIRTSEGLEFEKKKKKIYGNILEENNKLLLVGVLSKQDNTFVTELKMKRDFDLEETQYAQVAVLYNNQRGIRKLKVSNLRLKISTDSDVLENFNLMVLVNYMIKNGIKKSMQFPMFQIRQDARMLCKSVCNFLYKKIWNNRISNNSQLMLMDSIKDLPYFTLALSKCPLFCATDRKISIDTRSLFFSYFQNASLLKTWYLLMPACFSIHTPELTQVPLLKRKLQSDGVYFLYNGMAAFLWIGNKVKQQLLIDLFGEKSLNSPTQRRVPDLNNLFNQRFQLLFLKFKNISFRDIPFLIVKQGGKNEKKFLFWLMEDKTQTTMTYYEYVHLLLRDLLNKD
ncbi:sec24-related protein [Anaeramoeba flamelloides]|uniref:Sec24-related protein n=1 Tax=Anaeramoeba flamelloides TaxID=1746091 RepID=A0AAV8A620_9EUKA|nr:sec24-related protein [Anaeramoeba flamelloides]